MKKILFITAIFSLLIFIGQNCFAQIDTTLGRPPVLQPEFDRRPESQDVVQPFTPSKGNENEEEIAQSVCILTRNEIAQAGALNIPEALRLCPKLIVRQKTNGVYDVHILGNDGVGQTIGLQNLESNSIAVFLDGMPLNNAYQGHIIWEAIPIDINDLSRIEIIATPSSTLYGANALMGVIYLFTKKEKEASIKINANLQGGRDLEGRGESYVHNAYISGGITDKLKYRFSGNYHTMLRTQAQNAYYVFSEKILVPSSTLLTFQPDVPGTNSLTILGKQNYGINGFLQFDNNKAEKDNIFIQAHLFGQNSLVQTVGYDLDELALVRRDSRIYGGNIIAQLQQFNIQASYTIGDFIPAVGYEGFKFSTNSLNSSIEYNYKPGGMQESGLFKSFLIRPGLYYSNNSFQGRDTSISSIAGSIRVDAVMDKFRFYGGIRTEKFDVLEKLSVAYQVGATYAANPKNIFRIVYSTGYQAPYIRDFFDNYKRELSAYPGRVLNFHRTQTQLLPQQSAGIEISYKTEPLKSLVFEPSLFYRSHKNYIKDSLSNDTINPLNTNLKMTLIGASVQVKYQFLDGGNVTLFATYQYNNVTDNFGSSTYRYTPTLFGGLSASYKINTKILLHADMYLYDKQLFANFDRVEQDIFRRAEQTIDAKVLLNARVSYKLNKYINGYINGRNLLFSKSREFVFGDETNAIFLVGFEIFNRE